MANTLRPFFAPRSIAIVGASRNMLTGGFAGHVFPINPRATAIESLPAFARVTDVPDPIDLALIAVPAACVDATVDDCLAKHIPAIVVLTAGFGETGAEGRAREAALRARIRRAGARMVGPNCLGLLTTDPAIRLNATFTPAVPPAGPIAFTSQSGALGLAVLRQAQHRLVGISSFVSVGNKADVSTNDLLEYWEDDPRTSVILMYVESFGHPERFRDIARRVGRRKPIVAVKAGRSSSGSRAALSHTGALASSDVVVDALFRDAGVIRVDTLEELFDVAVLLAHQPLPHGSRVAILTNAGGPAILAADVCDALGLTLPALAPGTLDGLREFLPATAGLVNPIDMIATATPEHYRHALALLLADPGVDSVLVMCIPIMDDALTVARVIRDAAASAAKPVLATMFGTPGAAEALAPVPCYTFPEPPVRALAHAVAYQRWRSATPGAVPRFPDLDIAAARDIVATSLATGNPWLSPASCDLLMHAFGIQRAPTVCLASLDEALAAAERLGYPVVLKGSGPTILHKTNAGTVITDIGDGHALREAYAVLASRPDVQQIVMQPMVGPGVEMLVGAARHDRFGHLVMCGSGGIAVELLHDISCRLAPLSDADAQAMLDEVRGVQLLRGFRGRPVLDEPGLRNVLLRVSALLAACPEIAELDLNPVTVTARQACVLDARIRLTPSGTPPQVGSAVEPGIAERGATASSDCAALPSR